MIHHSGHETCRLPEGCVEEDVEDHVGRRVDDEHKVADASHAGRPNGEVSLSMLLEWSRETQRTSWG